MTTTTESGYRAVGRALPGSDGIDLRPGWQHAFVYFFITAPVVALIAGVVVAAFGHVITWLDVVLAVSFYALTGHGVTVGFHRYLTHGAFKTGRPVRMALAIAGSMSIEGSVIRWVADHRQHHAHADRPGDPHSPWRFGHTHKAVVRGLIWAHIGWLFDRAQTPAGRYAPDLLADPDIRWVDRWFPAWAALSVLSPPLIAFAASGGSWWAALLALIWASLVRVLVLHHVTWSINSICHMWGTRPYRTRDQSRNVWPLALLSMGESWHNLHHADPTCARHGVLRGQIDSSARLIAVIERLGWIHDVRWPRANWLAAHQVNPT
jgi:stearoyl-CoA desaturase (delta-9 desaturase)